MKFRQMSTRAVIIAGAAIAMFLAGIASYYASSSPDGLEKVGGDLGFTESATTSAAEGSALAGYAVSGIDNARISGGLAGIAGVLVVALLAFLMFKWVARGRRD